MVVTFDEQQAWRSFLKEPGGAANHRPLGSLDVDFNRVDPRKILQGNIVIQARDRNLDSRVVLSIGRDDGGGDRIRTQKKPRRPLSVADGGVLERDLP